MSESMYKHIIDQYLTRKFYVDIFIDKYFAQWKSDRDSGKAVSYEPRFQRLIDRLFTSCDCYREDPGKPYEISEEELRQEVDVLRHIWWR
jgi:hypothetical protein